jgi:cytidyltransferase-like protein
MPSVFLPMCADMFHIGHVNILKIAASYGNVTVLLMTDDAMTIYKHSPLITYEHRKEILLSNEYVQNVMPCDGPQTYGLEVCKHSPDFFVHGDDWKQGVQSQPRLDVLEAMEAYGGQVIEPAYTKGISSTDIQSKVDKQTLKKHGVLVQTSLNDLKRTVPVVSSEIGVDVDILQSIVNGSISNTQVVENVILKMKQTYPINARHITLTTDTSKGDMWHMTKQQSETSARIFNRTNANGETKPYYRYMDTATSALAPFKPELIEILTVVQDNEAMNPLVVMNKGHLLTQQTFFIGPVNFYCTIQGVRYCKPMNTGDSCLITPYVPHSFTKRDPEAYAAIVAVTFSGNARDVLPELMHLNAEKCLSQSGNARTPDETRQKRIERYAELRGLTLEDVQVALQTMPMDGNREFIPPTLRMQQENEFVSDLLNVPENTFCLRPLIKENEVTYASRVNSTKEKFALASALHIPDTGGYDWHFSGPRKFEAGFFSYIYNYGDNAVSFNEVSVGAGASIVVKPFTHVRVTPQGDARLVVVHVGGWVSEQLLNEMSTFATEGRQRITSNSTKWW